MTKQDKKSGSIRSIRIGGGFTGKIRLRKFDYPPDSIAEFLRLNTKNDKEVLDYCSNYQLIGFNISKLLKQIKIEQLKLRTVADKFFNHELVDEQELRYINRRLSHIRLTLSYPARTDGLGLSNSPKIIKDKFKQHEFEIDKIYPDVFSLLWESLIIHFLKKQDIRQCFNCGNYFVRLSGQNQLFCSYLCKNKLHQKRNKAKKKIKNNPL